MATAAANEALSIAGTTWEKGKSSVLIRSDRLHPSRHALAALAISMLDAAGKAANPPLPTEHVRRDLEAVYTAGIERGKAAAKPEN